MGKLYHPIFQPRGKGRNSERVRGFLGEGYTCRYALGADCNKVCHTCKDVIQSVKPVVVVKRLPRTVAARLK